MDADSVPYGPVAVVSVASNPRFSEQLRPTRRGWRLLPVILVVSGLAIAPFVVALALLAWLINLVRFWRVTVTVDEHEIRVGRRRAPLGAFDLTTLGRAHNTWPWRIFSRRWLGANPIWTRDSVGIRGFHEGKPIWVSIGTDRRDELVGVLTDLVPSARERLARTVPGAWHVDPWDATKLRWWDGAQWTGWTWPPAPDAGPAPFVSTGGR